MPRSTETKKAMGIICGVSQELVTLGHVTELLGWDQQVYMPRNGIEARARQVAYLSELAHNRLVSKEVGGTIKLLQASSSKLPLKDKALLRNIAHDYEKAVKLPGELVKKIAEVASRAQQVWQDAKRKSNFPMFEPYLAQIVKLLQEVCDRIGYKGSPYDVLLDDYEEGMTESKLDSIFLDLKQETAKLLRKVQSSNRYSKQVRIDTEMSIENQKKFGKLLLERMGFEVSSGRIDEAEHPFTSSFGPQDIRLTTHYFENDFTRAVFSTIHEAGHGLYEQGFAKGLYLTGLDEGISLGIHESQSRTWENIVGRSEAFWKYFFPRLQDLNKKHLGKVKLEDFLLLINRVKPDRIRIYADEVTYNLHIIIRFEIEKALIKGKIKVKELPEVWNAKVKEYLGVKVPNDAEGVLQDVHWSLGSIGYFPTYSLGNLYAAQFYNALKKDITAVDNFIGKGDLVPIRDWLRKKIHRWGHIYTAGELCKKVTGHTLSSKSFIQYINRKFSNLYGIK